MAHHKRVSSVQEEKKERDKPEVPKIAPFPTFFLAIFITFSTVSSFRTLFQKACETKTRKKFAKKFEQQKFVWLSIIFPFPQSLFLCYPMKYFWQSLWFLWCVFTINYRPIVTFFATYQPTRKNINLIYHIVWPCTDSFYFEFGLSTRGPRSPVLTSFRPLDIRYPLSRVMKTV